MTPLGRMDDPLVAERPRPVLRLLRFILLVAVTSLLVALGVAVSVLLTVD